MGLIFILSATLCLFIGACSPFTLKVSICRYVFIAILLIVFFLIYYMDEFNNKFFVKTK